MKYGITGATGSFGTNALQSLAFIVKKEEIVALARTPKNATTAKELDIEIRESNFDNKELLVTAFKGIEKLLLVSTNEPITEKRIQQHKNAIDAAKESGVKLIVYTSGVKPDASPLGAAHLATEKLLKESGITYIILRNNLYLETKINDIKLALDGKEIVTTTGNGKMGLVLRKEYADAAVQALLSGAIDTTDNLSENLVDYPEFIHSLSKVLDKKIQFNSIDDENYQNLLNKNQVPAPVISLLVSNGKSIRNGSLDVVSSDFEKLLGRKNTSIEEGLKQIIQNL